MLRTLEATIDKKGKVKLAESVRLREKKRALVTILDEGLSEELADERIGGERIGGHSSFPQEQRRRMRFDWDAEKARKNSPNTVSHLRKRRRHSMTRSPGDTLMNVIRKPRTVKF